VDPGDLIGPGDDHCGRIRGGSRHLDGQPLRDQFGEHPVALRGPQSMARQV
jgi:hypothetical protein